MALYAQPSVKAYLLSGSTASAWGPRRVETCLLAICQRCDVVYGTSSGLSRAFSIVVTFRRPHPGRGLIHRSVPQNSVTIATIHLKGSPRGPHQLLRSENGEWALFPLAVLVMTMARTNFDR